MGRLKNVSGEAREVPLLDNRVVEPDEVVDVDDQLLEEFAWPASTWQVEADKKPAKAKAAAAGEEG